jgi:hypothetical protein
LGGVFDGTINLDEPNSGNTLNTLTAKTILVIFLLLFNNELCENTKRVYFGAILEMMKSGFDY